MLKIYRDKFSFLYLAAILSLSSFAQAQSFKIPEYESYRLANGLQVFLLPQKEVPLLQLAVAVKAGSTNDGAQLGLASFTAEALDLGTKSFSKNKLEELFDFYGAEYSSGARQDYSVTGLSLAAKDVEALFPAFAELFTAPVFPSQEVKKLRDLNESELRKAKESPNQVADQYFNRILFAEHPYGHPVSGTPNSLKKLQHTDLIKFHTRWYHPDNAALVVVGDFDSTKMKGLLQKNFGNWTSKTELAKPLAKSDHLIAQATESRVVLVNKDGARETTFRIGGLGVKRDDKDWISLQVLNTILGGRFTSMLNQELRIKSGLTYGARSRFDGYKDAGSFVISSFTATDNTDAALALAAKTYRKFLDGGLDEQTLASAKAYVKGQFPPRYETLSALGGLLLQLWVYQLPDAVINNFDAEVDAMNLEKATALIKKHFPAEKLSILLIGEASKIRETAKKYGTVVERSLKAAEEGQLL